jgi:transposase-like protein
MTARIDCAPSRQNMTFPGKHWRRIPTNNPLERILHKIRRPARGSERRTACGRATPRRRSESRLRRPKHKSNSTKRILTAHKPR